MEMEKLKNKYLAAYDKIKAAENILLVTHERPDGDGLASMCAMSVFLDKLGKKHTLYCPDPAQDFFSFLPNINRLAVGKQNLFFPQFDLIVALDCGSLPRTGLTEEIRHRHQNQIVIEFDHHPKTDAYSDLEIRATISSTAEVLYYFFYFNNLEINKDIANCLLTGILTDTGNLLFDSVTEETMKISSAMILRGATFPKITRHTLQNKSLAAMKTWGKILDNLRINEKYNLAFSVLTFEEIQELKKEYGDENLLDAAVDILNNVDGVKAVVFLREEEKGKIRGSLRTKDQTVDVARLASFLDGGGHPRAAAFRLPGNIVKMETGWKII